MLIKLFIFFNFLIWKFLIKNLIFIENINKDREREKGKERESEKKVKYLNSWIIFYEICLFTDISWWTIFLLFTDVFFMLILMDNYKD